MAERLRWGSPELDERLAALGWETLDVRGEQWIVPSGFGRTLTSSDSEGLWFLGYRLRQAGEDPPYVLAGGDAVDLQARATDPPG